MAIIRDYNNSDLQSYLATVALFCGISCTILMLKFRGFKASLNLSSGKRSGKEHYELAPQLSVSGAYRTSKDEYYGNINYTDHRKVITPSMVKLPPTHDVAGNMKPSRSTGDLSKVKNTPVELRKSTPNVATSVPSETQNGRLSKQQLKEQKKIEKERLADQKKRDKLAAQERGKEEKLRKDREKQASRQQAKEAKEKEKQRKKKVATPPPPQPQQAAAATSATTAAPQKVIVPQQSAPATKQTRPPPPPEFKTLGQPESQNTNPLSKRPVQYSTNTLESSISRTSGPPPYSDTPEVVLRRSDNTGNTSFVKSDASSSWDLISQHRQQINRTPASSTPKQKHLDLQYNVGNLTSEDKDNSEA